MANFKDIQFQIEDRVATITLNRPQKGNSITPLMGEELAQALAIAERDPAVTQHNNGRLHVLCWRERASTGVRVPIWVPTAKLVLDWKLSLNTTGSSDPTAIGRIFDQVKEFPKPVIARVQGPIMGGGKP